MYGELSRPITSVNAILDDVEAARGTYDSLAEALAAKAGEAEIEQIYEAIATLTALTAKKQSKTCDTQIEATQSNPADMDMLVSLGTRWFDAASATYIDHLPTGYSGAGRVDTIELPGDLRQQTLRSAGSTPGIYVRNSTSAPEPVVTSLIPAMSGYTTPSGEVIESGNYSSRYGWLAFDGVDSQTFSSHAWSDGTNVLDGGTDTCYVGYIWDTPQPVSSIKISFFADTRYVGCIQCRVGGVWQTVISAITLPGYPYYTEIEQELDEPVECDGIRFCVLSGDRERFSSSTYGGNVCEFSAYGEGSLTASWGAWSSVTMS